MSLTYRQLSLVEMLVYAGSVTITYLSQNLNVSRKAIYDDLDSIRVWLRSSGIGELMKDSLGRYEIELKVQDIDSILFSETQRFRNYEINERHAFLLYFIVGNPELTQEELTDKLQVSRNTLQNDLQMIRRLLKSYDVGLGYQRTKYVFKGSELQIRSALINLIGPYLQKLKHSGMFETGAEDEFEALSPNARDWLSFALYIQNQRIACGQRLTESFLPDIHTVMDEDYELCYTECLIRGMSKPCPDEESAFRIDIKTFIQTFVSITGTALDRKVIDVLFRHLEPAYYRGIVGVVLQNPILDEVKKKYFHTYQLMKMVLRNIIPFPVSEQFEMHESSYITLLILSHEEEQPADFKLTVACYEGTSVSHLVKHQLVKIGISTDRIECRSFEELKSDVDFLITTIVPPDTVRAKKWLRVSPILTYADQVRLKQQIGSQFTFEQEAILKIVKRNVSAQIYKVIMNELQNQHRLRTSSDLKGVREIMLKDLLTEETIQVVEEIDDWQSAIDLAAKPLLKSGKIEPAYVQAVKENILTNGAYIVLREGFALPHARPSESVNELSMSLLVLKKAVGFTDGQLPVQVIVFLAAVDSSSHLNALSELIEVMSDEATFHRIRNTESEEELLEIIQ